MKIRRSNAIVLVMLLGMVVSVSGRASEVGQQNSSGPPKATADADAIKQTALDYIEGWYEGNAERMERALHPELAKRIVRTDPKTGRSRLDQMSALSLVQGTRAHSGKPVPKEKQQKDVTILDVFEGAASVKVVAADWIDYLQMSRFNGRWVIVNVLWELKPETK